ncbi:MAG TPA: DUF1059 domain-containing protein [Bryocella sp.]|nr:DUF1059 domain-containing protein [Bryocella sp.]
MPKTPKTTAKNDTPSAPRTNPSVDPKTSTVNPSAPTVGTEAWGNTSDERKTMGKDQPADLSRRTSASAHSLNTNQPHARNAYRCADIAGVECGWETSGDSEDEVMRRVEEHWRQDHAGLADWSTATRNRVRDHIRHRKAA